MIPEEEHEVLIVTIYQAFTFGINGQVGTGYILLCSGLAYAKSRNTEWAAALQSKWARALTRYKEQYPTDWYVPIS